MSDKQLVKQHPNDAGLDIVSLEEGNIFPCSSRAFKTNLQIAIPAGFVGIVKGRSGLSIKHSIEAGNAGVIDAGYRGEIMVKLYNFGLEAYHVSKGDRIAQLLVIPIATCQIIDCLELPPGDRGNAGFGSTGV